VCSNHLTTQDLGRHGGGLKDGGKYVTVVNGDIDMDSFSVDFLL